VFGEFYFSDAWQIIFAIDNWFLLFLGLSRWQHGNAANGQLHLLVLDCCTLRWIFHFIMIPGVPISGLPCGGGLQAIKLLGYESWVAMGCSN